MSLDNNMDMRLAAARAMDLPDRMVSDVKIIAGVPEYRPEESDHDEKIDIISELLQNGPMSDEP